MLSANTLLPVLYTEQYTKMNNFFFLLSKIFLFKPATCDDAYSCLDENGMTERVKRENLFFV